MGENKHCSGPDTLAKDCGSKWKYAAQSCCDGPACDPDVKFCREQSGDALTCAVDGEKSLDCGSKMGKQSCCEGLVCHEDQYWRCVKPGYTTCSGPHTLAQECGSEWEDASEKCCQGLVCGDESIAKSLHQVPEELNLRILKLYAGSSNDIFLVYSSAMFVN